MDDTIGTVETGALSGPVLEAADALDGVVREWYESHRAANGGIRTNVMTVPLVITARAASYGLPLDEEQYLAHSQVSGLSGARIGAILRSHGIDRPFTAEGGRTSRGSQPLAIELVGLLNAAPAGQLLTTLSTDETLQVWREVQRRAVVRLKADFFDRRRLEIEVNMNHSTWRIVNGVMRAARDRGIGGPVAQHLVGAKLAIRFPNLVIPNHGFTTADQQTERAGDFQVGDTVLHVTVSPTEKLVGEKCVANLRDGLRPVLLVPEGLVAMAKGLAQTQGKPDEIGVTAIEDFVALNIDELAEFARSGTTAKLRQLLETYNARVEAAEADPAYRIAIPSNL